MAIFQSSRQASRLLQAENLIGIDHQLASRTHSPANCMDSLDIPVFITSDLEFDAGKSAG
jgi:hypothetical protein